MGTFAGSRELGGVFDNDRGQAGDELFSLVQIGEQLGEVVTHGDILTGYSALGNTVDT
jgi:hypothetical protein